MKSQKDCVGKLSRSQASKAEYDKAKSFNVAINKCTITQPYNLLTFCDCLFLAYLLSVFRYVSPQQHLLHTKKEFRLTIIANLPLLFTFQI